MPRDIFTAMLHLLSGKRLGATARTTMGTTMADNHDEAAPDRTPNRETYSSFTSMTKWGVILVVVLLALMAVFLV